MWIFFFLLNFDDFLLNFSDFSGDSVDFCSTGFCQMPSKISGKFHSIGVSKWFLSEFLSDFYQNFTVITVKPFSMISVIKKFWFLLKSISDFCQNFQWFLIETIGGYWRNPSTNSIEIPQWKLLKFISDTYRRSKINLIGI